MVDIELNELVVKAQVEESNYNWKAAAKLYQQAAKSYWREGVEEKAFQLYYSSLDTYIQAMYASENPEELEEIGNTIIEALRELADLYDKNISQSEILECKGLSLFIQAILFSKSKAEVQKKTQESLTALIRSYELQDNQKNKESLARISYYCSLVAIYLCYCLDNPEEMNDALKKCFDFATKSWNISKEIRYFHYLTEILDVEMMSWFVLIGIRDLKDEERWKEFLRKLITRCDESLKILGNSNNARFLRSIYSAKGVALYYYGFYYIEEEIEQGIYIDQSLKLIEECIELSRKARNNSGIIMQVYNLDYFALTAGKLKYLQKRISEDIKEINEKGDIFANSNFPYSHRAYFLSALYYTNIAQMSIFSLIQRRTYAEKGIEFGERLLGTIVGGYWDVIILQELVWSLSQLINLTTNKEKRNNLSKRMENYAIQAKVIGERFEGGIFRATAFSSIYRAYKTLSDIADTKEEIVEKLRIAIDAGKKYIEHAIESRTGKITARIRLGLLFEEMGILTSNNEILIQAKDLFNFVYDECIERKYYSYAGVTCEYIARIEDRLSHYAESATFYRKAKNAYKNSLNKVDYRPLKKRITEKMNYNEAWSLIEDAKNYHKNENHLKAKESYEKAIEILKDLASFSYEADYFSAWAIQEEAEYLSKLENHEEATEKYKFTQNGFDSSINNLNNASNHFKDKFTLERIEKLKKVAQLRIKYCSARADVEKARILGKQGEYSGSAELFATAASQFRDVCYLFKNERERGDLEAVYYLCRAWESMELAEKYRDPDRFTEASKLFTKASKHFNDSKLKLLASGNSAFCQALELGCKFDEVDEYDLKAELYQKIRIILRKAAASYEKGGFEKGNDWVLATSIYFDAGWSLIQADNKLEFDERSKLLEIGSEYLKSAALLFKNAGYEDKEREVLKRLSTVEKEEKIIFSALNSIKKPSISGTTTGIIAPSCSIETSQSPRLSEVTQFNQEEKRVFEEKVGKKYEIIYRDIFKEHPRTQKREVRVGIAQIGVSRSGNIMNEFYNIDSSGMLRIQRNKVSSIRIKVKSMIENAHNEGINVLVFPEMSIDLNFVEFLKDISDLAKLYEMYIIPGAYHDYTRRKNIAVVVGPYGILWEQEKHIPAMIQVGEHRFKENIEVGQLPRKVVVSNTEFGRIAVVICRDFLDMDLRVELKNFEPSVDIILNPAFTPVTADFKAIHFDARRSLYAYCFFANIAEFGDSLIYTPEKDRTERSIPSKQEDLIYKDIDIFKLRSERKKWENEKEKELRFIQSTR